MKKVLATVLSLAMIICSLPATSIAFAADDAMTHTYSDIGMTLVSNNFDNVADENLPSATSSSLNTASTGEFDTTRWYVNNKMVMNQAYGSDASTAIEFIGSGGDYPGAFIDLDNQFFGSDNLGTDGYTGLTEGVVVTEFDIMANSTQLLSLLGTGSTTSSSIASSVSSAYIFKEDGTLGNSSVPYYVGEWGRVKIVSNLSRKAIEMYYNDVLIHKATANYGFGLKQLGEDYGLMFQGGGSGLIDFVVDNMTISYTNAYRFGTAAFDTFEMPANYRLDAAFAPQAYVEKFDFGATTVSLVEGKNGTGDKAMKFVPNGATNPNYRYYFQNTPYKGAATGVLHGQFDVKLEANFKLTLSNGWGLEFGEEIFSVNGSAGSATYNNTDWYQVDVITDYETGVLKVYLDGTLIKTKSAPSAMMSAEYFQIIVWGNSAAGDKGVLFDNMTFDYYPSLPKIDGVAGFKTALTDSYMTASEVPANATDVKLALTKAYTKVDADDVEVTVGGVATSVEAAVSGTELDITFPEAIGATKEVVVKVLGSATVGVCSPANVETSVTFTTTSEEYIKPVNPYAAMEVDELTIFPADGKYVYEENTLPLKAYGPAGITDAKFYLDGAEVAVAANYDNLYVAEVAATNISNGIHTFKVVATINGESVTKEAGFNFYSGQTILVYNTFDELTSTPTSSNCNVKTTSAYGPSTSLWTFNNSMVPSLDTGKGGKGKALRFSNATGVNAGAQLSLNDQFFGVTTLGNTDYPGGISEGNFVTEFDMKINTAGQLGFLGLGSSAGTDAATSVGAIQLSTASGNMGSISEAYTVGKWVHVAVYTNYAENSIMTVVDGKIIHDRKAAAYPFGNKYLWERYGLMFQAQNAIDISIDNFTIRYSDVHEIGHSEFDAYTGSMAQIDASFVPRNYSPLFDGSNATVSLSTGFKGGKALSIAPNGSGNPNYRFYYQNKSYRNATTGVLHTSFDAKLDAFMDVCLSDGFGLFFGTKIFDANGKLGSQSNESGTISYNAGEWYHVDVYSDWNNNQYDIYVNNILALSEPAMPYALLRNEYFQFLVYGNQAAGNAAAHFDNIKFEYYEAPMLAKEATLSLSGDVITFPMSATYASIAASDVTLKINDTAVTPSSVELEGNNIKVTLPEAINQADKAEITIGKNAKLGTLAIQNKTYSAKYDGFGLTVDSDDVFGLYQTALANGTTDMAYLDDSVVATYNHILDENMILNNAVVTITENGEASDAMGMISVDENKVVVALSGLKAGTEYTVTVSDVMNADGDPANDATITFTTADFDVKADAPTVANGAAKATVYSAYSAGKTVRIAAATYEGNKLTGVVLGSADVTDINGEEITLDFTELGSDADKVFVWNGVSPLSMYTK